MLKACLTCRVPFEGKHARCAPCHKVKVKEYENQYARKAYKAQRYGYDHQQLRQQFEPMVSAHTINCGRCGLLINRGDFWHLDHLPNGSSWPSHQGCNLAAAAETRRQQYGLQTPPTHAVGRGSWLKVTRDTK